MKIFATSRKVVIELEDDEPLTVEIIHRDKFIKTEVQPNSDRYDYEVREGQDAKVNKIHFYERLKESHSILVDIVELMKITIGVNCQDDEQDPQSD